MQEQGRISRYDGGFGLYIYDRAGNQLAHRACHITNPRAEGITQHRREELTDTTRATLEWIYDTGTDFESI